MPVSRLSRAAEHLLPEEVDQTLRVPTWKMAVSGLPSETCREIESRMRPVLFKRGAFLHEEFKRDFTVYLIRLGRVKSLFVDASGKECIRSVSGPGALHGILSSLCDTPSCFTVQAMSSVSASAISQHDFVDCMTRYPSFAINVAKLVAAMYSARLNADKMLTASAPVRLGKVLADLATRPGWGSDDGKIFIRGVTHQDLASMVGVSRTWVTLMLATFEEHQVIKCRRGEIEMPDRRAFAEYLQKLERETA